MVPRPETQRTRLRAATCVAGIAAFAAGLSPSCGSSQRPPVQDVAAQFPAPDKAGVVDGTHIAGHWSWSHVTDDKGTKRVEREQWELATDEATVKGTYSRLVTFLSVDGTPFECSQTLSYTLATRYQLSGTLHSKHITLAETSYQTTPSPCEGGHRRLGSYEGFYVDKQLLLVWKGGSQTLTRTDAPSSPVVGSDSATLAAAGAWQWQNRTRSERSGEVRVEQEDWQLTEGDGGSITGTYLRAVTVFDADGRVFQCSGEAQYRYRDRYTIVGARTGSELMLSEVEVQADPNPCLTHKERHLDVATGQLGGDFVELTWRGGHRQVLHRPSVVTQHQ